MQEIKYCDGETLREVFPSIEDALEDAKLQMEDEDAIEARVWPISEEKAQKHMNRHARRAEIAKKRRQAKRNKAPHPKPSEDSKDATRGEGGR
ncbi:MAG: hypothetical protein ACYSW8_28070 [Planctomycetota bacterium]|jgi:hypothetical protein